MLAEDMLLNGIQKQKYIRVKYNFEPIYLQNLTQKVNVDEFEDNLFACYPPLSPQALLQASNHWQQLPKVATTAGDKTCKLGTSKLKLLSVSK